MDMPTKMSFGHSRENSMIEDSLDFLEGGSTMPHRGIALPLETIVLTLEAEEEIR